MRRVIVDLSDGAPDALPEYDLCIVGTGPAGATVAAELSGAGLRICLLESGRAKPTARGDRLRAVRSEGLFIKEYSRERVLGGTSTTWAGLSAPLDPIDLAPREWVPRSGWPFGRETLDPYYVRAARYRFPALADFGAAGFGALRRKSALQPAWQRLEEKIFLAAQPPQDFGREQRALFESDAVTVLLDATVLRIEAEGGRAVAAVVRDSKGGEREVRARAFVLATGGIENARLLLVSGLGGDQVGRGFMNHPKSYSGVLHLAEPVTHAAYFFGCLFHGFAGYGGLRLPEAAQRAERLLNSYVRLEPLFPWTDNTGVEALIALVQRSKLLMKGVVRRGRTEVVELRDYAETGDDSDVKNARKSALDWLALGLKIVLHAPRVAQYLWYRLVPWHVPKIRAARLRNFMEMEPDPENRVMLGDERDEDGKPLPLVRSRCTDLDRRSMVAVQAALAAEVERLGLGRLERTLTVDGPRPWPIDQDASHHLGTTRMGADPATSVVTSDLRLHGVRNLYCAGASVFPTSGCANPTFTIVALSARLADHLRGELAS